MDMKKDGLLADKVVLITGSARGLGRSIALACAEAGADVAAHYFTSRREALTLRQELRRSSPKAEIFRANLKQEADTARLVTRVLRRYGRIDVLINSVGNFLYKPLTRVSLDDFRDVLETNLMATFRMSQLVLPQMRRRRRGQIINFGCAGADRMVIRERTGVYYLAKTAVIQLTKALGNAYAPYGVRVNAVSPGILTSSKVKLAVPAGRYATFADIIRAIFFLLDPASSYITGANLEVSGGWIA